MIDVNLKVYEGPLDLLLSLIKEKRLDILDIPIALITKEYLEHLRLMEEAELEIAAEFVLMAATLMEIKAKMLLPKEKSPEELEVDEDPRLELVNRLIVYKQFKEVSDYLGESFAQQSSVFSRENINQIFLDSLRPEEDLRNMQVNLYDLCNALQVVLEGRKEEEPSVLPREKITIDEQMNWLKRYIKEKRDLLFIDLFKVLHSKVVIVVTFLALLELVHRGVVGVRQDEDSSIYLYYIKDELVEK